MRTSLWLAALVVVVALLVQVVFRKQFDPREMAGKRVVVTGASMGIGEQIAYELSMMKAHVVIVARSKDKMERIVKKCTQLGAQSANYISVDLSTRDENVLKKVIDDAVIILGGGLDMLIVNHLSPGDHNVFKNWPQTLEDKGLPWLVDQYHLNVFSYFILSNRALPILERNHGKLVVVSSVTGILGVWKTVAYSSQKHAIQGYFNSLRANLVANKRFNTTITTCILGVIGTETMLINAGDVTASVDAAPVDECAREIISGGQMGVRTMFYPYRLVRPTSLLVSIAPELLEFIVNLALKSDEV